MSDHATGSVMDGIEFEKRKTVDADWSGRKRAIVGSLAGVLAIAAVGAGGYFAWQNRPVSLPGSAEEALAAIKSGRVDRLSPDRQRQYYAEAAPLLREIPRDEWRSTFDEEDRDAARQVMMAQFDESMRELARGNTTPAEMFQGFRRPRPAQGERRENRQRPEGEGDGERERRGPGSQRFSSRMQNMFQNGDAQRSGLMGEFFTIMRASGQRPGGDRGG